MNHLAPSITVQSQARARFCRRCGSAVPNDGHFAACAAHELARNAFIIPRPSQLGHGLEEVARDPVDDLQPLIPEPHSPLGDSSAISGFRAKLAAVRSKSGMAAATGEQSPGRSPSARLDAISPAVRMARGGEINVRRSSYCDLRWPIVWGRSRNPASLVLGGLTPGYRQTRAGGSGLARVGAGLSGRGVVSTRRPYPHPIRTRASVSKSMCPRHVHGAPGDYLQWIREARKYPQGNVGSAAVP